MRYFGLPVDKFCKLWIKYVKYNSKIGKRGVKKIVEEKLIRKPLKLYDFHLI